MPSPPLNEEGRPAPPAAAPRESRRAFIVAALMLAMFLAAMEATVVATAMPSIVATLGGFAEFTWVFSLYLLTQTAVIPVYGKLADIYGRRPVFAVGTGIFLLGSLLCGFSGSMTELIIFRAVQGVGAGAVQPIATTIIGDIFALRQRAWMQGWISSVWAFASLVGPLVGGFIVERMHWQWIFWINVPLGLLAITGVVLFLHEPVTKSHHEIDYLGAVLLIAGITPLLFALLQGGTAWPWTSPQSIGLLFAAGIILGGFILRETRAVEPIVPLALFRNRVVAVGASGTLLVGGMTLASTSFIPVYVQGALGASATVAGLSLAAMSIGWPMATASGAHVILALGYRRTGVLGFAVAAIASFLLASGLGTGTPVSVGATAFFLGGGLGFVVTTMIVAIQGAVPWSRRGIATASSMFTRQLGSTLWVAVLGGVFNAALLARLTALPRAVQETVGEDQLGVTSALLDPRGRAALDPAVLLQLEAVLSSGVHAVFLGLLATALVGLLLAFALPGGAAQEKGREQEDEAPA